MEEAIYSSRNAFIYFSVALSLPSAMLYCSELVVIVRHREFHNSFYTLFVIRAILGLLGLLNSFFGYRLPCLFGDVLLPFYDQLPRWLLRLYFFLTYYNFHADNLAIGFILLNRLSAIALPMSHEELWRRFSMLSILLICGIPVCFSYFLFRMDAIVFALADPLMGNRTSFILIENITATKYLEENAIVCSISALIFLFMCAIINLAIFITYNWRQSAWARRVQNRNQVQSETGNQQRIAGNNSAAFSIDLMERKLLVYALANFVSHLLGALLLIGFYVATIRGDYFLISILLFHVPWITDLSSLTLPSCLLLWASSNFRQQWRRQMVPQWLGRVVSRCNKSNAVTAMSAAMNVHQQHPRNSATVLFNHHQSTLLQPLGTPQSLLLMNNSSPQRSSLAI